MIHRIVLLLVASSLIFLERCCGYQLRRDFPPFQPSRQVQLALTASSQFRMLLSRTAGELEFEALEVIELVFSSFMLEEQSYLSTAQSQSQNEWTVQQPLTTPEEPEITDIEIVIQESEFQEELSSTRIHFFALATFVANEDSTESSSNEYHQTYLNGLIEQSLSTDAKTYQFVKDLRSAVNSSDYSEATTVQLQGINDVVMAPVASASPPSASVDDVNSDMNGTDSNSGLSVLDKIVIAISCGVCGGLLLLLLWNIREVGHYIAATRHQLLLSHDNTIGSFPKLPRYEDDMSEEESTNDGSPHFITTSFMSDENPNSTVAETLPPRLDRSPSVVASPTDFPILALDGPEFESHEEMSAESFGTNVFRSETKAVPLGICRNDNFLNEECIDDSQVGDEADEARSPPMDNSSHSSPLSSENRIGAIPATYFVPIHPEDDGTAEDEAGRKSLDDEDSHIEDDDDFSMPLFAAVDVSSIGHMSLEQSMASSTPPTI